jgi:hypothetical protein
MSSSVILHLAECAHRHGVLEMEWICKDLVNLVVSWAARDALQTCFLGSLEHRGCVLLLPILNLREIDLVQDHIRLHTGKDTRPWGLSSHSQAVWLVPGTCAGRAMGIELLMVPVGWEQRQRWHKAGLEKWGEGSRGSGANRADHMQKAHAGVRGEDTQTRVTEKPSWEAGLGPRPLLGVCDGRSWSLGSVMVDLDCIEKWAPGASVRMPRGD